jgi:hypothetical protein
LRKSLRLLLCAVLILYSPLNPGASGISPFGNQSPKKSIHGSNSLGAASNPFKTGRCPGLNGFSWAPLPQFTPISPGGLGRQTTGKPCIRIMYLRHKTPAFPVTSAHYYERFISMR